MADNRLSASLNVDEASTSNLGVRQRVGQRAETRWPALADAAILSIIFALPLQTHCSDRCQPAGPLPGRRHLIRRYGPARGKPRRQPHPLPRQKARRPCAA
jgi:hypothetical protein